MGQAIKILIVEDEDILAENLMTYIQHCGWEAQIASNGQRALVTAGTFLPQLLLLDYHLPDMTGFQVLDGIRHHCASCNCMLITGHCTEAVRADALQHGIQRVLCKPFPLPDLRRHLSAMTAALPR